MVVVVVDPDNGLGCRQRVLDENQRTVVDQYPGVVSLVCQSNEVPVVRQGDVPAVGAVRHDVLIRRPLSVHLLCCCHLEAVRAKRRDEDARDVLVGEEPKPARSGGFRRRVRPVAEFLLHFRVPLP